MSRTSVAAARSAWSRRLTVVAFVLLSAHVVFGVARLPGKVWARRLADVADYRAKGAARFQLENAHLGGAEVIEWLQQNVANDAVVLWRGESKGAMELVPGLLAPRLVVAEDAVVKEATTFHAHPLARGQLPSGERGILIVEGRGNTLALGVR